jgi:type II secretory pathway component PulL
MAGPYVIFAAERAWKIASGEAVDELRIDPEAAGNHVAAEIAAKLRQRGYQGEGVMLALPSAWCLSAGISLEGLAASDRAAMAFRLEEKLPLAAENFTADFIEQGDRAQGVCVPNDRVSPLVEALEKSGVVVQSVSPAAILALQQLGNGATGLLVWAEGDRTNVFATDGGSGLAWALASNDAELKVAVNLLALEIDGGDASVVDVARERKLELYTAAARTAGAVLAGGVRPWVELRRGAMAVEDPLRVVRRPINAALAAAVALCLVLAGIFFHRAHRYDRLAQDYETTLAQRFGQEFPGWMVPVNVRTTVEAELRKLNLAGSSALPPEAQESALRVLHDVLSKISAESKISFDRLAFNDTSVELDGRSMKYEDVDGVIAAAKAAGMEVPPPQMRKLADNSWGFAVRGSKPVRAASALTSSAMEERP